jgi:hypothetical protein
MMGGEDHSWSADAALGTAAVEKGLLQELQATVRSKALDRNNLCAVHLKHRNEAAIHKQSVD